MFRRSRATSLYRDGVPLEQVSALIGHSQIETTRSYYASPSPEQMKAAVEKGSNREPDQLPEWVGHTDDLKKSSVWRDCFIRIFVKGIAQ